MKKILTVVLVSAFVTLSAHGQSKGSSYKSALGLKVWDGAGISFKTFLDSKNAIEVIGYFYRYGTRITGLYEIHGNIEGANGLKWYVGPGVHLGLYNSKNGDGAFAGIDGVLGLDYKINSAPLNLSLDWQPSFEFGNNRGFLGSWGGLGIRYTF